MTRKKRDYGIGRRRFIGSGIAAAGALASWPYAAGIAQDIRLASPSREVQTSAGRIRGVVLDGGVNAFYGVPYAATTGGANRFMPPRAHEPWSGIRETTTVGDRSPQDMAGPIPEVYALDRRETMSETCLNLNVFTPALGRSERPVMVWLHGGGFTSGSGNWLLYDGARLARSQDVVVVPVTHRLNVFGYLHLAELGEDRYADSNNLGMRDIVAALEWVRDNIDRFGGDPSNVTIFGQSGGGGKVSALMAMPAAEGLFHRAIGMSGAMLEGIRAEAAVETAERFMAALGVSSINDMQRLPTEQLRSAFQNTRGLQLSPVVDGHSLPSGPFTPGAPAISASVPMMLSTVQHEVNFFPTTHLDEIDDAALLSRVRETVSSDDAAARKLIEVYRDGRPGIGNIDLYQTLASDDSFISRAVDGQADIKANQSIAPVYKYYFTWQSPVREGKLRAYHCVDIPFAFNNVEVTSSMTGARQDRYALASRVSAAFANFARTGNPNHDDLPDWPAFDTSRRATMIFDDDCRSVDNPYAEERAALKSVRHA